MTVEAVTPATLSVAGLPQADLEMLKRHAEYGCLSLVCRSAQAGASLHIFLFKKTPRLHPAARHAARLLAAAASPITSTAPVRSGVICCV